MPKFRDLYQKLPDRIREFRFRSLFTRKRVLIAGGVLAAFLIITPIATYAYYARDINDRELLMNHNNTGVVLKDHTGKVFYEYGHMGSGTEVPLDHISKNMQNALIASEDKDFYHNDGISLRGMARAIYGDLINADPTKYGGSTITQQLVKNKLLNSNKTFLRKYQEVAMAIAVDRHYSKQDILDMYLNSVYFGGNNFGISDAAHTYFNTTPDKLTVAQSAMLVGLLPAPNAYSPIYGDKTLAVKEQHRVLDRMQEQGYITSADKQVAEGQQLQYADASTGTDNDHAQHFAQMILAQLKQKYGEERINRSGFEVTTSLDLDAQKTAEKIIKQRVDQFRADGGTNASLVAMDPKTGMVRALVGSVDWNQPGYGQVNMATMPRQPGSSFKPIYYSYALDKHMITAATPLEDKQTTFGSWTPKDVDGYTGGPVTVRAALAQSMNVPAVEVMQKVTPETAVQVAKQMGITTIGDPSQYGLTLAIGTAEVPLTQMTDAYTTFANSGTHVAPVYITSIQDKYGNNVYKYKPKPGNKVISPDAAFILSSILADNAARAPLYGTSLNISGHQVAVKTGTTDNNVDAWTIGYTPSMVVGVWAGNNNHHPMGPSLYGGSSAGKIWHDVMTDYLANQPNEKFTPPPGVHQVQVCRGTGQLAAHSGSNTYGEFFIAGTEPTDECNSYHPPAVTEQPSKPEDTKPPEQPKPAPDQTATQPPVGGRGGGDTGGGTSTTPPPTDSGGTTTTPPPSDGSGGTTTTPPSSGGGTTTPPSGGGTQPQPQSQPAPPKNGGPATQ